MHSVFFSLADNEAPTGITPSAIYKFPGEAIMHQLEGIDPEERPLTLTLFSNHQSVTLFPNGSLHWPVDHNSTSTIWITVEDDCGVFTNASLELVMLFCPCQHNGICHGTQSGERQDGFYTCDCPFPFGGALYQFTVKCVIGNSYLPIGWNVE